jgi:putative hydrolase of the HAD superfamily
VRITAVVLDLDDTLAIVERDRTRLLADACEAVGAPAIDREAYVAAHADHRTADTREPIFEDLLSAHGVNGEVDPSDLATAYRDAIGRHIVAIDGAQRVLDRLTEEYRLGLLTNGPVRAQGDKLDRLGWGPRFDAVVISGRLDAGKPDSRAFQAVLDELAVQPDETVHVGDQVGADVRGAKAAGLSAVQVIYDGGPEPHPDADAYVDRSSLADDLPQTVRSLRSN